MNIITLKCILFLVICAGPVVAGDWQKLNGAEIEFALTARTLGYEKEKATQDFFDDGRTLYNMAIPSWGRWRVKENKYCSLWPPSTIWVCYDLERHKFGLLLRFVSKDGHIFKGKYIDLD